MNLERWIMYALAIALGLWIGRMLSKKKQRVQISDFIQTLDVDAFAQSMRKGQLIDLRKEAAYQEGHIKGARRFSGAFLKTKHQRQVRKDQPVYLYCARGQKAKRLAPKLVRKGYRHVFILKGGFDAYQRHKKH
ncbi:MAG: rhodanese-like domain-containing protein [Acholeplasmatales bacterium]|nr:MAG: rhodanese-like domain-containing protein [Acholeplasmatales bacterium]